MKLHAVSLTDDAKADLQELYDYIAEHDAPVKANGVLDKLGVWAAEGVEDKLAKIEEHVVILASQ